MTDQIPQMQLVDAVRKPTTKSRVKRDRGDTGLVRIEPLPEPSVAQMLQEVIKGGITADNVSALESLVGLYDRMQAKNAEREFASALIALQGETSSVQATKAVDEKPDGTVRYRFAPYTEIMRTVKPMLTRHGFSVTFDTETGADRLTSICTLMHKSGHSRQNRFAVRYSTPPGASHPQGDMSTKNYAKRGALCDCLNIVVEHSDDDGRAIGATIGKALAEDLEQRVKSCGADRDAFLKYAGASDFESISDLRYDMLDGLLLRKESVAKRKEAI